MLRRLWKGWAFGFAGSVFRWACTGACLLLSFCFLPSLASLLFVLAAFFLAPVKQLSNRLPHLRRGDFDARAWARRAGRYWLPAALALFLTACYSAGASTVQNSGEAPSTEGRTDEMQARLDAVNLTPTTGVLEYSDLPVDPLTLVRCSDEGAEVSASGGIDLRRLGRQELSYVIHLGDKTKEQNVAFEVRDTRAPNITLAQDVLGIVQGDGLDVASNVSVTADPVDGALPRVEEEPVPKGSQDGKNFYEVGWYLIDGSVDTNVPGSYELVVRACDASGNSAKKSFRVEVSSKPEEKSPDASTAQQEASSAQEPTSVVPASEPQTQTYVLNTHTHKFHREGCRDISRMKDKNKKVVESTREELIVQGYSPCGHCNP